MFYYLQQMLGVSSLVFSIRGRGLVVRCAPFSCPSSGSSGWHQDSGKSVDMQDRRITGSTTIDEQIQQVLSLVFRDFIYPWCKNAVLRLNSLILVRCKNAVLRLNSLVFVRCKNADWATYLTTRLVDDVAGHLRLFREARQAAQARQQSYDLVTAFFDKEAERERDICRDNVCLKEEAEKDYLSDLLEIVVYFLLPPDEFSNAPLKAIVMELLISAVLRPLLRTLADPDYINRMIVWACTDIPISTEMFVNVIKATSQIEELDAIRTLVCREMTHLRSQDSGGREEGTEVKQQINSLDFLRRVIDARINRLDKGTDIDSMGLSVNYEVTEARGRLFQLPLDAILKNSLTLDHFLNYLASVGYHHYLNLYLNIECWRTTVSERFCALELDRIQHLEAEARAATTDDFCQVPLDPEAVGSTGTVRRNTRHAISSITSSLSSKSSSSSSSSKSGSVSSSIVSKAGGEGGVSVLPGSKSSSSLSTSATLPGLCHDHFSAHDLAPHKLEAEVMYEQYLSEKANPRVLIGDSIVKRLILRLRSEKVAETWFDEVRQALVSTMMENDLFLPGFRRSVWYVRLLAELDLLRDTSRSDEEDSQDDASLTSLEQNGPGSLGSSRTGSPAPSLHTSPGHTRAPSLSARPYTLSAAITAAEVVREGTRSHAVYQVRVVHRDPAGKEELWHVFRRYSDFHDFHLAISSKFLDLSSLSFPSKKMLNNLAAWFLEKRRTELNEWLGAIVSPPSLQSHPGLQDLLLRFLDHTPYHQQYTLAKRVEEGLGGLRVAVRSMPDTVFNTVDGMVDGAKRFMNKPTTSVGGADVPTGLRSQQSELLPRGTVDLEADDNIPLRILLLLMDEVFELRSKDQWFRRRIVLFLRQILKAMFGDIVNRRIIDFVGYITSPEQVADYIKAFKESVWPNGELASPSPARDRDAQLLTQVSARLCLLSSISDELRALLGSQTSGRGVLSVYECVQWRVFNTRLLHVLLQGLIETVLQPYRQAAPLIRSLHTGSPRVAARGAIQPRKVRSQDLT
ncbi:Phox-associated domain [Trinorchestia longiramus]|nr:Phox-associated domain [Trinorchestia longiramus]